MTPSEFKAWFEGFTESMDGPPSHKQWEKVQARVKEITGQPVTYPVFVDRYWNSPRPYWPYPRYDTGLHPHGNGVVFAQNTMSNDAAGLRAAADSVMARVNGYATLNAGACDGKVGAVAFDSHFAMNALGKADAENLAA